MIRVNDIRDMIKIERYEIRSRCQSDCKLLPLTFEAVTGAPATDVICCLIKVLIVVALVVALDFMIIS